VVNIDLLYSFILCLVFAIANFLKLGLRNKTYALPSTFFALMWGLTSLGGFLYSNLLTGIAKNYFDDVYLQEISSYQLSMLIVVFAAFLLARFTRREISVEDFSGFDSSVIVDIRHKTQWILYLFFILGIYRLISVTSVTGWDYSDIRTYYLDSRHNFSEYELYFLRIASYLSQFAVLYICILGMESALIGIKLRKVVTDFLLFAPLMMSLGGRLFILAFFAPFIFSYLLTYSIARDKEKKIDRKLLLVLGLPVVMVIVVQILKMDEIVSTETIGAYSTEVFYTSSSYIHMKELWYSLPNEFPLGYGLNCLGIGTPLYNQILELWDLEGNPASVCVPSMIPQAFLDFGKNGSLVFFFIVFYLIEDRAMVCMKNLTLKNMLIIVLLCLVTYQTVMSSAFYCLRAFIVGYVCLIIFNRFCHSKIVKTPY
jgi:oligosaccharide repeat unit polymerase